MMIQPNTDMTGTVSGSVGTDRLVMTVAAWNPVATHQFHFELEVF